MRNCLMADKEERGSEDALPRSSSLPLQKLSIRKDRNLSRIIPKFRNAIVRVTVEGQECQDEYIL